MPLTPRRSMHPAGWVPRGVRAVLDVGCNVGELLGALRRSRPGAVLAGCDINPAAVDAARRNVPGADIRVCGGADLPWPDAAFGCVTCIETLEHLPPAEWAVSLREMRRVLAPGGRLVLRTPHAGLFGWLDSNNLRFRLPALYRRLLGRGRRDAGYAGPADVHWHHHFTRAELLDLAGGGWEVEATWYGGLVLFPLFDYLLWPFYRWRLNGGWLRRALARAMAIDYEVNYGVASYGILLVLRKVP